VGDPVIRVDGVSKRFGRREAPLVALEELSFDIADGQFVSLVGPSGCGKSTLLQIIGGLIPATTGRVSVDRLAVEGPQPGKIAIVFQDAMLLPWKSALENVEFPLDLRGMDKTERRRRSIEMLRLVGLGEFAGAFPHQLSGGMRQRVSIARGLAQDPRIILMDEPFGALDEQTRLKMGHELLRIWEATRKTIFLITHSLAEAIFLSDVVLVMSERPGRILEKIEVPMPRPRTYAMIGSPVFGELRNRIWSLITTAGDGAEEQGACP
jgi:NitT/TauT family transport system ATP-binding protein